MIRRRNASFSFVSILIMALAAAAAGQQGGAQITGDLTYTMPPGWVNMPAQAGPEVKAHYVLYSSGVPYCEMYLSSTPLAGAQTLDQAYQEAAARVRTTLPSLQPMGTQRTRVGGLDAIVADFTYYPAGSGVPFSGRAYVLIANATTYSFFFNTTSRYFYTLQGSFGAIMGSVQVSAPPVVSPPATTPPVAEQPAVNAPGAGSTVEENGLVLDLPAGWRPSNDPAGAKYRLYGPNDNQLASLFTYKPDPGLVMSGLFNPDENTLEAALNVRKNNMFKDLGGYAPVNTARTKMGGLDTLVHDFNVQQGALKCFYRWYFITVKEKRVEGTVRHGAEVQELAFMTTATGQIEALKGQWDAILATLRVKGAPVAPPPGPGTDTIPARKPQPAVAAGDLPVLNLNAEEPASFQDPAGRFKVPLPEGCREGARDANSCSYAFAGRDASLRIWSLKSAEEAEAAQKTAAGTRTLNGQPMNWTVGGKDVSVRLYTGKDAGGVLRASVTALCPGSGLLLLVDLPAKDYAGAQEWISGCIKGVQFLR